MKMKEFKTREREIDRAYNADIRELYKARELYIASKWKDYNPDVHYVATIGWAWDCSDSPFGVCAYDREDDPCSDFCLFCGEPEERK